MKPSLSFAATRRTVIAAALWATVAIIPGAFAQTTSPGEARAARALEAAKKAGKPELYAFLKPFPKGGDLHMHFSGAVYAETFLKDAIADNLCVDPVKLALAKNTGLTKSIPPQPVCAEGNVAAAAALKDEALYDKLVNSFSMRSFVPYAGFSGHDQFFATFDKFGGLDKSHQGEWLDELTTRAAAQNEQYLEIMTTPSFSHAAAAGYKLGWPEVNDANHMAVLAKLREELLASGLRDDVAMDASDVANIEAERLKLEHCDEASAGPVTLSATPTTLLLRAMIPQCHVRVHWLFQVLRGFPPQQVFAQTLLGFEVASADPQHVVGINFVRAEDRRDAMAEYHTEMLMLDYLHSVYPKVHISLHAGELAIGLVPPDGLTFHIREAIELGHAERIGHGVDVLYENNPEGLLKEMAAKHIDVEVNLTSNDVILGIKGTDHSLAAYREAHVPFSLSTDDEGVSRIDLTHEYVRAVTEQGLTYADLKYSARDSLEYSFMPGASLWASPATAPQKYEHRVAACAAPIFERNRVSKACSDFLASSEKATEQYELERRFATFEAAMH